MSVSRQHTSVRAYGVLTRDQSVLLVRSASGLIDPPLWWLPGGGINFAETPEATLLREFAEETGLTVTCPALLDVASDVRRRANGDRIHTVRIIYTVQLAGGQLRDEIGGTTDQAHWFALSELGDVNVAEYAQRALGVLAAK